MQVLYFNIIKTASFIFNPDKQSTVKSTSSTINSTTFIYTDDAEYTGSTIIQSYFLGQSHPIDEQSKICCRINFELEDCKFSFIDDLNAIKDQLDISTLEKKNQFKYLLRTYMESFQIIQLFRYHSHHANGLLTSGDGLCGYRALYQLYHRQLYQSQNIYATTDTLNTICNNTDPDLTDLSKRESFITFLNTLTIMSTSMISKIHTVTNFIDTEAKFNKHAFLSANTDGWMEGDRLPTLMSNFNIPGSFLLASNPTNIFPHLGIVTGSSVSATTIPYLLNYTQSLSILSGGYITFANSHFGVEPAVDSLIDIQYFESALHDVTEKMFTHCFIHGHDL